MFPSSFLPYFQLCSDAHSQLRSVTAVGEGDLPWMGKKHAGAMQRHRDSSAVLPPTPLALGVPHRPTEDAQHCAPVNKLVLLRVSLGQGSVLTSVVQSFQSCRYLRTTEAGCIPPCQPVDCCRAGPSSRQHRESFVPIRIKAINTSGTKNRTSDASFVHRSQGLGS